MKRNPEIVQAARAGDLARVRALLNDDAADPDEAGAYDRTALHEAAERDDRVLAELLIDAGADMEREADWGDTPLEWAGLIGARSVADLLVARGARRYDLVTAAGIGNLEDTRRFMTDGPIESQRPRTRQADTARADGWVPEAARAQGDIRSDALVLACRNGHVDVAKVLIDAGADVDARGYFGAPALHWAAIHGHDAVVELLLGHGADPALHDAKFDGDAASWAREGGFDRLADRLARRID